MTGDQRPEGYDAGVYYMPEANVQNTQLILSQIGDDTNWKMCWDSTITNRVEAKVDRKHTTRTILLTETIDASAVTYILLRVATAETQVPTPFMVDLLCLV